MTLTETVYGVQEPRFLHMPTGAVDNRAGEAVELMAAIGMPLDPWQILTLEAWLGERADGSWAATQAGIVVARQNGKNAVLEARELAGLFLFGERRIVHSAHEGDTAREAYKRMCALIESVPWLDAEVAKMPKSPTAAIVLKSGAELSYRTRTAGGGRGFSAPVVVLDEAQELTGEQLAAIQPLVSSFPRRQLIFTGTVLPGANVFQGVVERGRNGSSGTLGYAEWSAADDSDPSSVEAWLSANPSVGYRMTVEAIRDEWETASSPMTMTIDKFKQERLSIWPDMTSVGSIFSAAAWSACYTKVPAPEGQPVDHIGIASTVDGKWSSVAVAFERDGHVFVQLSKHEPGTDWVIPYVQGLVLRRRPRMVVVDQGGPASKSLANGLTAVLPHNVLRETKTPEVQAAVAQFVDAVAQQRIEHRGQPVLTDSVLGVRERIVGDARLYDRRKSPVVVSPVEAVTLAAWGLVGTAKPVSKYETGNLLVLGG